MKGTNAVTTLRLFGLTEERLLFAVNAGIPVEDALEVASNLMDCVEAMAAARGLTNRDLEANAIQYLTEASNALVRACRSDASAAAEPVH